MANRAARIALNKKTTLHAAAKLFLEKGYSASTMKELSDRANLSEPAIFRMFGSKENILCALVEYVLESQFETALAMIQGKTQDKMLFYAAETVLQLHIVESNEYIRELYGMAYSMPNTTAIIQNTITDKLEDVFKEHLPYHSTQDFYMLEIASGGIMRGFMAVPCSEWFTMEKKVRAFLEATFRVYSVPQEKIEEAIRFVSQFDYPKIAKDTIQSMLSYLDGKIG